MIEFFTKLFETVVETFFAGFFAQYVFIIPIYIIVWVLLEKRIKKFRIQTTKKAGVAQIRRELITGLNVIFLGILLTPVNFWLTKQGYLKLYTDTNLYGGVLYVIFTVILLLFVSDAWFYWTHRYLHHKKFYQYVHAVHHQSLDVTPFTSLSFHILEAFVIAFYQYIVLIIFPVSIIALGIAELYDILNNIKGHLGYEFYPKWFDKTPLKFLTNSTHHNLHHTSYNGNYGLYFTYWDRICGTELHNQEAFTKEVKSHKKSTVIKDNTTYKTLFISKIEHELDDVVSIYFTPIDDKFYDYLPGQYLTINLDVEGSNYERLFSLSSCPITDKFLRITVKKHKIVSDHLINKAKVGDEIKALYPSGDFVVNPEMDNTKDYLMIAGGSGITPIYSMIKSILNVEKNSKIKLLYANSDKSSIIFEKELQELSKNNPNFIIDNYISGIKRIDKKAIEHNLNNANANNIFICGPESLKLSVSEYIKDINISNYTIETEDFADGYIKWFGLFSKQ